MKLFSKTEIFPIVQDFLTRNPNGVLEILGPTASGKTGFGIAVARRINTAPEQFYSSTVLQLNSHSKTAELQNYRTEIISADSRQVYIGCDISAAKISPEEMQGIPHHGIDLLTMDQPFDVKQFQDFAFEKINEIQARGNIPILCGGTMLWLDAVSENYEFSDEICHPERSEGSASDINQTDSSPDQSRDQNDKKFLKSTKKNTPKWPFLKIGLHWEREVLYERINQRAVQQFESGLIEETQEILDKYQIPNNKDQNDAALQNYRTPELKQKPLLHPNVATSFGYQEIAMYLEGLMTYEECLSKNQQRNRNYAKRQLTWWRGREDIVWVNMEQYTA